MICNKCGKEIPDGSSYCGFCGASQTLDVTETLNKIEEAQMIEDAKAVEHTAQTETAEKSGFGKIELPKVDLPKVDLPKINVNWNEFAQLWEIIKNPFNNIKLNETPLLLIIILAILINWLAIGKLATSFLIGAVAFAASLLCEYLDEKEPRHLSVAVNRSTQRILVPSLFMLAAGITRLTMGNALNVSDAVSIMTQLSGMMIRLHLYLFFIIAAWAVMAVTTARMTRRVNGYIVILVYIAVILVAIFTLSENSGTILSAIISLK